MAEKRMRIGLAAGASAAAALTAYEVGMFAPVLGCVRSQAWPAELIALHVIADGLIATAYVWIPAVLVFGIWTKLKARPEAKLLYLFGAFIVLCGWTHVDNIVTTWLPAYWYSGVVKLATGIVSIATAITLTRLAPQLVGLGSMAAELQTAKDEAERLRKGAEARAIRAEGENIELEQAQTALKHALAKAERLGRDALESARIAEAARTQAEAAISERQAAIRAVKDLSTPVLPVMDKILAMPLIGTVDSIRAEQAIESIMTGVSDHQAEVLILDLTGVPVVDTQVADAILKTAAGVKLLGAQCIITGIRPAVAQTIVSLGIDMATITTRSTLKAGIAAAMEVVRS